MNDNKGCCFLTILYFRASMSGVGARNEIKYCVILYVYEEFCISTFCIGFDISYLSFLDYYYRCWILIIYFER